MTELFLLGNITLILLLVAIGIFGFLAVQSKKVKSFQFQISIILIIWITGEIVDISGEMKVVEFANFELLASVIHMITMILISTLFWVRFYYSKRRGKKLSDDLYE